jgi:cystathionine gamma-synthase
MLEKGYAVTYASGQAATTALILAVRPKRLAIEEGYHGTQTCARLLKERFPGLEIVPLSFDNIQKDDLLWLETPKVSNGN